ncbi:Di-sulfide bridge nucleocytoplasmic transport domain-containing protein [Mycena sp. CBHHK59/15]|nr:Di-sulfide bridge nucleocytoplasmic transport domain-containing protein [Mycena sp. CBHHK59/15]
MPSATPSELQTRRAKDQQGAGVLPHVTKVRIAPHRESEPSPKRLSPRMASLLLLPDDSPLNRHPTTRKLSTVVHGPVPGQNIKKPFSFQTPPRPQPPQNRWRPPPNFDPSNTFPSASQKLHNHVAVPPRLDDAVPENPVGIQRVFQSGRKNGLFSAALSERDKVQHESDRDDDGAVISTTHTHNISNHYTLNVPSPPAPHLQLFQVLPGYSHFFFMLFLKLLSLYLSFRIVIAFQRDVDGRISEYSLAMVQQCAIWAACMSRDPTIVGRAKVVAEMIAEVVNGFVDRISWKTLTFTLTSLSFATIFINTFLSICRSRH